MAVSTTAVLPERRHLNLNGRTIIDDIDDELISKACSCLVTHATSTVYITATSTATSTAMTSLITVSTITTFTVHTTSTDEDSATSISTVDKTLYFVATTTATETTTSTAMVTVIQTVTSTSTATFTESDTTSSTITVNETHTVTITSTETDLASITATTTAISTSLVTITEIGTISATETIYATTTTTTTTTSTVTQIPTAPAVFYIEELGNPSTSISVAGLRASVDTGSSNVTPPIRFGANYPTATSFSIEASTGHLITSDGSHIAALYSPQVRFFIAEMTGTLEMMTISYYNSIGSEATPLVCNIDATTLSFSCTANYGFSGFTYGHNGDAELLYGKKATFISDQTATFGVVAA